MLTPNQQNTISTKGIPKRLSQALRAGALAFGILSNQGAIANDAPAAPAVAASAPSPAASAPDSAEVQNNGAIPFSYEVTISSIPVQIAGKAIDASNLAIFNGFKSGDLLTQMDVTPFLELEAVNQSDSAKLADIKRAILTKFLTKYTEAYLPEDGTKKVYMYCSEECADELAKLLKDTKIDGLEIRPYGAKFSPVINNEYAAIGNNTLVISATDLWAYESLSRDKKKAKADGFAERNDQLKGEIAEIEGELSKMQKLGIAAAGIGLAGTALGGVGIAIVNRRRKQEVAILEERSKAKGFEMELDEYFRKNHIFFDRDLGNGTRSFMIRDEIYNLRTFHSLEDGGSIMVMNSKGEYLTQNGSMSIIRGASSNHPKVSIETFQQFVEAQFQSVPAPRAAPEGDVPVLLEGAFHTLEVEDFSNATPRLLATLSKIDTLFTDAGIVLKKGGKLNFLNALEHGTKIGSRICKFDASGKKCEIYVDDGGMIQVTINGVSTPNAHDVADFAQCEAALRSIFD